MKVGNRRCQCRECGKYFNSVAAFDKHRIGSFLKNERRCMTTEEMQAKRMDISADGYWVSAKMPELHAYVAPE